ncbi:MAG: cupin domain-containing protein [Pseudomonadota bacterium]
MSSINPRLPQSGSAEPGPAIHLVRYEELIPCKTAFIDTRTPGSAQKENFTIIGPGVSENPEQHVHIKAAHGFNIGGARQPPNCTNSQHSHETAEVFIVHSGRWAFYLGENQEDGRIELGPGDTISIPVHVFRGFENIGEDTGFLFAVLGGDDPGNVLWAPYVFEQAKQFGLVLMDDGSLHDSDAGEGYPAGKKPQRPTTAEDVAKLRRMTSDELAECVVRYQAAPRVMNDVTGLTEAPLIGGISMDSDIPAGKMSWPHGFHLRYMQAPENLTGGWHSLAQAEVLLMHRGELTVRTVDEEITLKSGDTLSLPVDSARAYTTGKQTGAEWFVVHGTDHPAAATPAASSVE